LYGVLLYYISPKDISNVAFGDKSYFYLAGAKFFYPTYPAPGYLSLGWLVIKFGALLGIPDGLSMILFLSIIPSVISAVVVYLFVKAKMPGNSYAPWVAVFAIMGFWSWVINGVRAESYNLVGMLIVLGVYLSYVRKQYWIAVSLFAAALTCHWLNPIPTVAVFTLYNRNLLKRSYILLLGWLVYIPFLDMGMVSSVGVHLHSMSTFLASVESYSRTVVASGDFSRIPNNLENLAAILSTGMWIAIIPMVLFWVKGGLREKIPFIAVVIPFLANTVCSSTEVSFMQWSSIVPLMAVGAGLGCQYLPSINFKRAFAYGMVIPVLILPFVFSHLDTNPTEARNFINSLSQVPDNSYILCQRDATNGKDDIESGALINFSVVYYDRVNGKSLIALPYMYVWYSRQQLTTTGVTETLISTGFNFPGMQDQSFLWYGSMDDMILQCKARILEFNPDANVYYFKMVDGATWKSELVKVGSPEDLAKNGQYYSIINKLDQRLREVGY
jgi:drug/metabolite transporter superfamily protein YnfA